VNRDDVAQSPRAQFAQLRFADRLTRGWRMDIDRDFDRLGIASCLETSTEENRRFNGRRGFEQAGEIILEGGPDTWWLRRDPKGDGIADGPLSPVRGSLHDFVRIANHYKDLL
jgi:hypothetical protein